MKDIPTFNHTDVVIGIERDLIKTFKDTVEKISNKNDRVFLSSLVNHCLNYGEELKRDGGTYYLLDLPQVTAICENSQMGKSKAIISRRYKRLTEDNILKKVVNNVKGKLGRQSIHLTISNDEYALSATNKQIEQKDNLNAPVKTPSKLNKNDIASDILKTPKKMDKAYSERFLNNVLFACGRLNNRDSRTAQIITQYKFRDEFIKINTTSQTGTKIFSLNDQVTMLAIMTLIVLCNKNRESDGAVHRNEYYFDINQICSACGLGNSGGNRKILEESIERLYRTNMNIKCPVGSEFAQYFNLKSYTDRGVTYTPNNFDFKFIWEKSSQDLVGEKKMLYQIALHPIIYRQLLDPNTWNTFNINPRILRNRIPIVNHLYFFASRIVDRKSSRHLKYPIQYVRNSMMPSIEDIVIWETALLKDLAKFCKKEGQIWHEDGMDNIVNIFGYYVKISKHPIQRYSMTFWFDSDDVFFLQNSNNQMVLQY